MWGKSCHPERPKGVEGSTVASKDEKIPRFRFAPLGMTGLEEKSPGEGYLLRGDMFYLVQNDTCNVFEIVNLGAETENFVVFVGGQFMQNGVDGVFLHGVQINLLSCGEHILCLFSGSVVSVTASVGIVSTTGFLLSNVCAAYHPDKNKAAASKRAIHMYIAFSIFMLKYLL